MAHEANEPIYVTRTFLPPRAEYDAWLDKAYASHVLTNNGPIHRELEETLRARFDVPHLRLMANGTLALQLAIRALGVTGKVITTPFSYVATTSAILWEGCEPVFVDIDPRTCCIDPTLIEAAITPDTTAILATHVYGIPCDVEAIDAIAKRHGLKVIYDAAHAFDVQVKGRSILAYGDASTLSFHATKLFHTVEGGAVVLHQEQHDKDLRLLRSFGHIGDEHFSLGMNAKMSEVHAAMGMAVLPYMERIIAERKEIIEQYDELLGGTFERPGLPQQVGYNYSYYPLFTRSADQRERIEQCLAGQQVFSRRYFYPSLDELPYVSGPACVQSRSASDRVICLPLYNGLAHSDLERIVKAVRRRYYATYTAFDGKVVLPQLLETEDFSRFRISTLNGPEVKNKGLALFPRKIDGQYVMLSRQDGENLYIMFSDMLHFWYTKHLLIKPTFPWEFVQVGNCGSPIETEAGWLVLSHGVGAMRKYSMGAFLLDLKDPTRVIGRLCEPLLAPNETEREGYVPNVIYSCGGVVHNGELIIPYAMSDYASTFATVALDQVLDRMQPCSEQRKSTPA